MRQFPNMGLIKSFLILNVINFVSERHLFISVSPQSEGVLYWTATYYKWFLSFVNGEKQGRLMTCSHYMTLSLIFGSLTGFWSSPTKAPDHKQISVGSALIVCVNRRCAADAYQISSTLNISTCQGFCHFLTLIVWVSIPPTPGCGSTHDTHWGFLLVKYLVVCDPHIMWKA